MPIRVETLPLEDARNPAVSVEACAPVCRPVCPSVFDRVVVSYIIRGPTRIMYELLDTFLDPRPLEFQLQAGRTASPDSDDWENVGVPVVDQYVVYDAEQRVFGKTNWTHYRIKLTTPMGVYFSTPVGVMGTLGRRDWRLAREVIRARLVAYKYGPGGQKGYLLKRRVTGQKCTACTDYMTQEVRDPNCPICYGTGFECGYFYPVSCVYAEMTPRTRRTHLDGGQARGTISDVVVRTEMLMTDLLEEDDVWVNEKTDDRWYIHEVRAISEMRGVPLIANVELRLVPFTSRIYEISIPEQLSAIGL